MSWLDRYTEEVKRYLPKNLREDVGEELESLLGDKIEEATGAKGSPLDDCENVRLLKEFGHPLQVASGYPGRRVLISEALFPGQLGGGGRRRDTRRRSQVRQAELIPFALRARSRRGRGGLRSAPSHNRLGAIR